MTRLVSSKPIATPVTLSSTPLPPPPPVDLAAGPSTVVPGFTYRDAVDPAMQGKLRLARAALVRALKSGGEAPAKPLPSAFDLIAERERAAEQQGRPIIKLSSADMDLGPSERIKGALEAKPEAPMLAPVSTPELSTRSVEVPKVSESQSESQVANRVFRTSVSAYMARRFGVDVEDLGCDIVPVRGATDVLERLPRALICGPTDLAILPDPGYPVAREYTERRGGRVFNVVLSEDRGFLVDLDAIPEEVSRQAKFIYINYPHNPSGALAPRQFLEELVAWAKKYGVLVVNDMAYAETYFDSSRTRASTSTGTGPGTGTTPTGSPRSEARESDARVPLSLFSIPGAADVAVEIYSASKAAFWPAARVGWIIGSQANLERIVPTAQRSVACPPVSILRALAPEIALGFPTAGERRQLLTRRRDNVVGGLRHLGLCPVTPRAGTYVWARTPANLTDVEFAAKLLDHGVSVMPGTAFGPTGRDHVRIAITADDSTLGRAMDSIGDTVAEISAEDRNFPKLGQ